MHLSPLKSSHPCAGETTGSPQYTYFLRLTAVKYVDPKHFSRPLEYPPLSIVLVKVKCQSEVLAHVPYLNMDPALTVLSFRVLLTRLIRLLSAAASLTALLFLLILSLFLLYVCVLFIFSKWGGRKKISINCCKGETYRCSFQFQLIQHYLLLARRELIPWHTFSILLLFFFHDLLHITKHLLKVIS